MPKLCIIEECKKVAVYGITNNIHCIQHRLVDEINKLNKKCKTENCDKLPIYGFEKGIGLYCKTHKKENMVDVKSKKCIELDCNKVSNYNLPYEKYGLYCVKHKKENMVDIKNKKCKEKNCNIQPTYNYINKTAEYCVEHKKENMVDVKSKRCLEINCNNYPTYNYKDKKSGLYCNKHKKENMIVIRKRCIDCDSSASYNFICKKPLYCNKHKKSNMIDVINFNNKCKNNCEIRGNKKYKGYCVRCFIYLFPDEKISVKFKVKEQHLIDFLKLTYGNNIFTFDKNVGGCSKRRPDAYIDLLTHVLVIECDEHQHNRGDYSCENKRTMQLFEDFGSRPVVFIRFNPDKYLMFQSSFKYHKTTGVPIIRNKDEWCNRLNSLKETVNIWLKEIPTKEVTEEYLFYDKSV
jgi:hypothetical protein